MEQTVVKIGNSAGVVIPKELRKQAKIKPGDKVLLERDVSGAIVIYPKGKVTRRSSITPEFLDWLKSFNKRYSKTLSELARY